MQNSLFTSNKGNLIYNSDKGGCCESSQSGAQRPLLLGTPEDPQSLPDSKCEDVIRVLFRLQEPVIQRQLMSDALNSAQMLKVCVLRHGGGGGAHSKGESSSCLLPVEGSRVP